jgi:thioester reductase-like protein
MYCLIYGNGANEILGADAKATRRGQIAALVDKYTWDLPAREASDITRASQHIVILTGSTGSLGSYLLYELVKDPSITLIYCLNRSDDAAARQASSFKEKGLAIPPDFHVRVEFLQAKFGSVQFGLSDQKYNELRQSVDLVVHNAWKVNFNHKVEAFEDVHIRGVRRLVDFSIQSTHRAHIHFISSISTIGAWCSQHGPSVLEIPFEDPDVVLRQGYGESKHIAERICAIASIRSAVPTSIHRVGQIGGPTTTMGQWNPQEWLPSIIATSKTIGQVPQSLGNMQVDWVPVVHTPLFTFYLIFSKQNPGLNRDFRTLPLRSSSTSRTPDVAVKELNSPRRSILSIPRTQHGRRSCQLFNSTMT